jgi:ATP-dependent RNA helicase SUPV3L1/SUV3
MLEHETGLIGLPLRLLAREVYDRVTARLGEDAVALVTGEEKRVPARPRYWICTVEAMPERLAASLPGDERQAVDFLAVDEIQLGAHHERGHVFTDRLLHWRGRRETWFLGSDTMRPLVERLCPTAVIEGRPRLSTLTGVGSVPIGALPPRTAVVAFSATRVYEIAERLRARRGGAAVVLGALSPRARNAQVALYQAGDVDYLVATDAIGMGLNMDVDLVVFADLQKFDGRRTRPLEEAELAQIAGRAGRHHNDGRFGTLAPLPPLEPAVTRALERHRFAPVERVYWRSRDLDLRSPEALLASLSQRPPAPCLTLPQDAEDATALVRLLRDEEVRRRARGQEAVERLWEVCQIPDFRQLAFDDHHQLLRAVYLQLSGPRGRLEAGWIDQQVRRIEDVRGDIHTLLARLAFIRTWTYVTHHAHWVDDAAGWQARTREAEERLSDALHEALVRRFVDEGRPATRRPRAAAGSGRTLADELRRKVLGDGPAVTPLQTAGLRDPDWLEALLVAGHDAFHLDEGGRVSAGARRLGKLVPGADLARPELVLEDGEALTGGARLRLQRRLLAFVRDEAARALAPLDPPPDASAPLRGTLYLLRRGLGTVLAAEAEPQRAGLSRADRAALRRQGVVLGRQVVYAPALLAGPVLRLRAALCSGALPPGVSAPLPPPGVVCLAPVPDIPDTIYTALGFPRFGPRAVRADVADEVAARLDRRAPRAELAGRLGLAGTVLDEVLDALAGAPGPAGVARFTGPRESAAAPRGHRPARRRRA